MNLDGWVMQFVGPGLQPGEAVMGAGHMRRSTGGEYQPYDECVGVATDRRLLVFGVEVTGVGRFTVQPKVTGKVVEWWYQDLDEVGTRNVGEGVVSIAEAAMVAAGGPARVLSLRSYEGLRPTDNERETYLIPRDSAGLSGQAQLHAQFADWLAPRVRGRQFPLTPDRQQFHAQRQAQRAAADAARQRAAAESGAMTRRLAPYLVALVPFVMALVCLVAVSNARQGSRSSGYVLASPSAQDPSIRARYEADRDLYDGRVVTYGAGAALCLLATAGAAFWAWRRNRRAAGG